MRVEGGQQAATFKWLGGYTTTYSYLGDYHARMLGVGNRLPSQKVPAWLHTQAASIKQSKGGASRHDPSFRGWG
jgi:hypothetical protein